MLSINGRFPGIKYICSKIAFDIILVAFRIVQLLKPFLQSLRGSPGTLIPVPSIVLDKTCPSFDLRCNRSRG